jgi:hypothetical protein
MHVRQLMIIRVALAADHGDEEGDGLVAVIGPLNSGC